MPIDPDAVEYIPTGAASTYIKLAIAYGTDYYESVADHIADEVTSNDRLLDAGTGPGLLPIALAERVTGLRIDAFDFSATLIRYANAVAKDHRVADRVSWFVGDCNAIPVVDGRYSVVTSTGVLHSLDHPGRALGEYYRVLEPGGRAWVFDPTVLDVPAQPDIELTEHEHRVFEAYGVERPSDSPTFSVADAERLVDESPFESGTVDLGERGDVRLILDRE